MEVILIQASRRDADQGERITAPEIDHGVTVHIVSDGQVGKLRDAEIGYIDVIRVDLEVRDGVGIVIHLEDEDIGTVAARHRVIACAARDHIRPGIAGQRIRTAPAYDVFDVRERVLSASATARRSRRQIYRDARRHRCVGHPIDA
jgi:hypothetical protein